ncbi:MAG: hypothetical protein EBU90_13020 [Proteobacteria bacterium]|nr:hypothetical protein [Pseudomonadota bacterium]NBP15484.1 hypothetical protein [bacterium]
MEALSLLKDHSYISKDISVKKYKDPYNYVIIDNLFNNEIYNKICKRAPEYIARQNAPIGKVGDTGMHYNALIYTMKKEDCVDGFDFFGSKFWQDFVAKVFDIKFNQHNAYSLHWHKGSPESPSKSGWSHSDLSICSVVDDPSVDIKLLGDCEYAEDTYDVQPNTTKVMRSVAILYYFNNDVEAGSNKGGGTAIYSNYRSDSYISEVEPLNNRVFMFEISPKSYHGFVGAKFDRTAIVHWFHSIPSYVVKRNEKLFRERYKNNMDFFEYWKKGNRWTLDMDPEYYNYFDRPFDEEFTR